MISEIRRDISLTLFLKITVFLGSATDLRSQNQSRPQFEVASIKPNKSDDLLYWNNAGLDRFASRLGFLLQAAECLDEHQPRPRGISPISR